MHRTLLIPIAVLVACAPSRGVPGPTATAPAAIPMPGAEPPDIDQLLGSLSLRDKAAQLIVPWVAGTYTSYDDSALSETIRLVDSLHVGGLIVSVGSPLDVAAKLNALQSRSRLPLLIAADLEGGTAIRLVGGTPFPTNMGVGASGRDSDAYAMGEVTAEEGRAVGIHLAFAPVADVNNDPANPIINTRSFGEDPRAVARLVAATVRGLEDHGMSATAKHFPGHGDTGTDSHLSLPIISADWRRLDTLELIPFRAAIEAGATAVMSAHIALPALEGGQRRPGTVDPAVLTGLLRDSLHFQGLTVTDALNMSGLVSGYGATEAPVLALIAGADLLLQPADPRATVDAIEQAVRGGRISEARLDRSVRKVLALKQRLGLFTQRTVALENVPRLVGSAEHEAKALDVAGRSIVLLADDGTVDSLRAGRRRLTLVSYGDEGNPIVGPTLLQELRTAGDSVSVFRLWPQSGPASLDSARAMLKSNPMALFAVAVRAVPWRGRIGMPDALAALIDESAATRPTVLVSLGSPYLISQTTRVRSYLLGWAANPISETAVARALSGAPISGRLPIRVPP
ncbi:MAG TPA: glycoside hydrolase family 3 N-terminal domain-containing protein, partial [Gemmatimonadales bacterium]|nr:glycoside hydrolase family 3 N-terminal domain-containing protein [Gemmatimonadales bacterium]